MTLQLIGQQETNLYYLTVSGGRERGCSLAGPRAQGLWEAVIKVSAGGYGHRSSQDSTGKGSISPPTHVAVGRIRFLTGCWAEIPLGS